MHDDQYERYVVFAYTISIVFLTFKRYSDPVLIRPGESVIAKGMPYTLLTLALGWWGVPFGPIFTIWTLYINLVKGGEEV